MELLLMYVSSASILRAHPKATRADEKPLSSMGPTGCTTSSQATNQPKFANVAQNSSHKAER